MVIMEGLTIPLYVHSLNDYTKPYRLNKGKQRQQSPSTVYIYSTHQWEAGINKFTFCSQIFLPRRCSNIHHVWVKTHNVLRPHFLKACRDALEPLWLSHCCQSFINLKICIPSFETISTSSN